MDENPYQSPERDRRTRGRIRAPKRLHGWTRPVAQSLFALFIVAVIVVVRRVDLRDWRPFAICSVVSAILFCIGLWAYMRRVRGR
jgi:hypothetical protein